MRIAVDRILTFVVGALAAALGAGFVLWHFDVEWVRTLVSHADQQEIAAAPDRAWWRWALGCIVVLASVLGVALLALNLRRRRVGAVELAGTSEFGSYTARAGDVANAAAALLERHHAVVSASAATRLERGRQSIRMTIVAAPDVTLEHVRRLAAECVRDIGSALAGTGIIVDIFVQASPSQPRH